MANVELNPQPMNKPAEQVSPFPKASKPAEFGPNERREDSDAPETQDSRAVADRIKRYQDASADAWNDIAQSMIRGWTEMVRGVRKAFDRF